MKLFTSLLSSSVKMSMNIFLTGYYSLESYRPIQWFPFHQELHLIPNSFKVLTTWSISYESGETLIFAFLPQSSVSPEEWQCWHSFCSWSFKLPFSWCPFSLNPRRGCFREQKLYISASGKHVWVWDDYIQGATSSTSSTSSTLTRCKLTTQCSNIDFELQSWRIKVCLISGPNDLDICVHTKFQGSSSCLFPHSCPSPPLFSHPGKHDSKVFALSTQGSWWLHPPCRGFIKPTSYSWKWIENRF